MIAGNPVNAIRTTLCIAAGDGAVSQGVAAARDFSRAAALPPDPAARLAIVVEELLFNLVDHGGLDDGDVIGLDMAMDAGCIRLTVTDPAPLFDPRRSPAVDAIPERGGGAGLAMVQAWAHIERYAREGGRNVLLLVLPGAAE